MATTIDPLPVDVLRKQVDRRGTRVIDAETVAEEDVYRDRVDTPASPPPQGLLKPTQVVIPGSGGHRKSIRVALLLILVAVLMLLGVGLWLLPGLPKGL